MSSASDDRDSLFSTTSEEEDEQQPQQEEEEYVVEEEESDREEERSAPVAAAAAGGRDDGGASEEEDEKPEEDEKEDQDDEDNETTETEESSKPTRALRKTTVLAGKRSAEAANSSTNSKASTSSAAPSSSAAGGIRRRSKVRMVEFDVEPIREQVICRLCEGLYREPYTTIKCFHTFCKSCLATALHSSKYSASECFNACPQCKLYLGRHADPASVALPDRTLETLIDKILFPQLAQQDREAERAHYRRLGIGRKELPSDGQQQQRQQQPDADAEEVLADESMSVRSKSSKRARSSNNNESDASTGAAAVGVDVPEAGVEAVVNNSSTVLFQLIPSKTESTNRSKSLMMQLPFLKTEGSVRVDQLKRYIFQKLHQDDKQASNDENNILSGAVEILCNLELLPNDLSVAQVEQTIWKKSKADEIMQLTYVCL